MNQKKKPKIKIDKTITTIFQLMVAYAELRLQNDIYLNNYAKWYDHNENFMMI